jgi:hypothetical protein
MIPRRMQRSLQDDRYPRFCNRTGMTLEQALDRNLISVQKVGDIYLTHFEFGKEFSRSKRMDDIGFREAGDKFTAI